MSKSCERMPRERTQDEDRRDKVDDRVEREQQWPRAAWSRAVASNA